MIFNILIYIINLIYYLLKLNLKNNLFFYKSKNMNEFINIKKVI